MKSIVNSPSLRLAALCMIVAAASGCPSPSETETTIKPTTKKSTKPTTSSSSGTSGGASASPSASPTSTTTGTSPNPNGSSSPKASTSPTASGSPTASTSPGTSPSPSPSSSATVKPSSSPSASASPTASPTTPVATATPTPSPTATTAPAGTGNVLTFAGRGQQGFIDAGSTDALFSNPYVLAFNAAGNALYVGDGGDQRIRKVDMGSKQVTTVTGSGTSGFLNGIGRQATFSSIQGLAVDSAGNIYVADGGANNVIRKVDMTDAGNPAVTTFAGSQGTAGNQNGSATSASFDDPTGLAIKGSIMYVADGGNRVIRAIDLNTRLVSTVAGSGTQGQSNGPGSVAQFDTPAALAIDKAGNLIVTDTGSHTIRRVSLTDGNFTVTTIAGSGTNGFTNGNGQGAVFDTPDGAVVGNDGALYVSDRNNHAIRRVDLNNSNFPVTTYAGGPPAGFQDAQGTNARFSSPGGLAALGNTVYVADPGNFRVRVIQ